MALAEKFLTHAIRYRDSSLFSPNHCDRYILSCNEVDFACLFCLRENDKNETFPTDGRFSSLEFVNSPSWRE